MGQVKVIHLYTQKETKKKREKERKTEEKKKEKRKKEGGGGENKTTPNTLGIICVDVSMVSCYKGNVA